MSTNRGKPDHADQPNLDPSDSLTRECGSSVEQEVDNLGWICPGYRTLSEEEKLLSLYSTYTGRERIHERKKEREREIVLLFLNNYTP